MKKNKLSILRKEFRIYNIDGYIIPKNDEFFGEYVDPSNERLKYLTGFSGSAGQALFLKKKAFLFVDGRYILQAQKEINKDLKVVPIHKIKPSKILEKVYQKLRIGFDPKLFSETNLLNNYQTKNITLVPVEKNLVDKIWTYKPKSKFNQFFVLKNQYTGQNYKHKINLICDFLKKKR